jgi:IS5 family transposase
MTSFIDFAFREEYERVKSLGYKLSEIDTLINWEAIRPIVKDMYDNKTGKGGRPNIDEIMMIMILVLRSGMVYPTLNLKDKSLTGYPFASF